MKLSIEIDTDRGLVRINGQIHCIEEWETGEKPTGGGHIRIAYSRPAIMRDAAAANARRDELTPS